MQKGSAKRKTLHTIVAAPLHRCATPLHTIVAAPQHRCATPLKLGTPCLMQGMRSPGHWPSMQGMGTGLPCWPSISSWKVSGLGCPSPAWTCMSSHVKCGHAGTPRVALAGAPPRPGPDQDDQDGVCTCTCKSR